MKLVQLYNGIDQYFTVMKKISVNFFDALKKCFLTHCAQISSRDSLTFALKQKIIMWVVRSTK